MILTMFRIKQSFVLNVKGTGIMLMFVQLKLCLRMPFKGRTLTHFRKVVKVANPLGWLWCLNSSIKVAHSPKREVEATELPSMMILNLKTKSYKFLLDSNQTLITLRIRLYCSVIKRNNSMIRSKLTQLPWQMYLWESFHWALSR